MQNLFGSLFQEKEGEREKILIKQIDHYVGPL